jgi:hypothetical protein
MLKMLRENPITAETIIELIRNLPTTEQVKVKASLLKEKSQTQLKDDAKEYAKRLKKFNAFVRKNRFDLPKDFKFNREEAHERI